ncbi:hypothetical protein GGR50DRAFT_394794 [Xylaria sp. CBS 124048]|nr:hypothetical protein GGR50DRAFT_394794 [Xylaria sp. CBS 124048]
MFARSSRQIVAPLRKMTLLPRPTPQPRALRQLLPRVRFSSTQGPDESKPQGSLNHTTFYKTFGRPIAKVFLLAIFTYQLAYYFWVRLEMDEMRAETQAIITDLEARIKQLEKGREQTK